MNLNTQCPQCGTTFQVDLEQLQLRKGYIRCINCAYIFDGYEAVVPASGVAAPTLASEPLPEAPPAPPAPEASPPSVVRHRTASVQSEPVFHIGKVTVSGEAGPVFDLAGAPRSAPEPSATVVHVGSGHEQTPLQPIYLEARAGSGNKASSRAPDFAGSARRGLDQASAIFWRLAVLLAVVLMLGQLTYIYRAQIASQAPALRPALEKACSYLNCSVAYSRRIDLITITSSALSAQTPAAAQGDDIMVLQLTLRNTYAKPQEWPMLELDLNDFSGTLQVRKNIAPQDYLTAAQLQQPFAAKSEIVLRLPIVLHGLNINGFQVRKFFP